MKTIEQKAKAYDKALKRAKEKYPTCYSPTLLEYIFPELKGSNNKEIRKEIISNLKRYINCIKDGYDAPSAKDFVVKEIEKQIVWLEKQGDKPQGKTALEAIKEEKVDNKSCVKSVYNDEPKFKVGDWVAFYNGNVEHITSVGTHGYTFDDGDYLLHDECDKIAHLWSIQDAKDGDILAGSKDEVILIFRGIGNTEWNDVIDYHCCYDCYQKKFIIQKNLKFWSCVEDNQLKPATKKTA